METLLCKRLFDSAETVIFDEIREDTSAECTISD